MDVPISVHVPPRMEPKATGKRNCEGLQCFRRATAMTIGTKIAVAATLLMKAETVVTAIRFSRKKRRRLSPEMDPMKMPKRLATPVWMIPPLMTRHAPIITSAPWPKLLMA